MKKTFYTLALALLGLFCSVDAGAQTWEWKGEDVAGENPQFYIQNFLSERFIANASTQLATDIEGACLFTLVGSDPYQMKNANDRFLDFSSLTDLDVNFIRITSGWEALVSHDPFAYKFAKYNSTTQAENPRSDCYRIIYDGVTDSYLYLNGTNVNSELTKGGQANLDQGLWRMISPAQKAVYDNFPGFVANTLGNEKIDGTALKTALLAKTYNWQNLQEAADLVDAYIALADKCAEMAQTADFNVEAFEAKMKAAATKQELLALTEALEGIAIFMQAKADNLALLNAITTSNEVIDPLKAQAIENINALMYDLDKSADENKQLVNAEYEGLFAALKNSNVLSVTGFGIGAGESKDLTIDLKNDMPIQAFQFDIALPEGIELTKDFAKTQRIPQGFSIKQTEAKDVNGMYRVVTVSADDELSIEAGKGAILTFSIKASENFQPVDAKIILSGVKGSYGDYMDILKTDNAAGEYLNEFSAALSEAKQAAIAEVMAAAGVTEQVTLEMLPQAIQSAVAVAEQAINNVNKAEDIEGVKDEQIQIVNGVIAQLKAAAIAEVKVAAGVTAEVALEDLPENIQTAVAAAEVAINAVNSPADIEGEKDAQIEIINGLIAENALNAAREAAIAALTNEKDSEAEYAAAENVVAAYNAAVASVQEAATIDDVNAKKEAGIAAIQLQRNIAKFDEQKAVAAAQITQSVEENAAFEEYLAPIAAAAKAKIAELAYDEEESLDENTAEIAAIQSQYKDDLEECLYVNTYIKGDIYADQEVDVFDCTALSKKIIKNDIPVLGEEATKDDKRNFNILDVNRDKIVNVADLAEIVNIILRQINPDYEPATTSQAKGAGNPGAVSATVNGNNLVVALNNNIDVVALQMDITVPGATVSGKQLFADRADAHTITVGNIGNDTFRVVVAGTENKAFNGKGGNILSLSLNGLEGEVEISNVYAADAAAVSYVLDNSAAVTGINAVEAEAKAEKVYSVAGEQVNGMQRGVNIMVGADGMVRKAIKK